MASIRLIALCSLLASPGVALGHGTTVFPASRVYRVYQSNPENPDFPLAVNAVALDGPSSYYTWMEVSRNIPAAQEAGLPPGFDFSPWIPDGQLGSAGRVDPDLFPRTYVGLDQVSPDWPTTPLTAGETITVDFLATMPHNPSVWDVWMTTPDWDPSTALNWAQMEFLGRATAELNDLHYTFDLEIPADRSGHHVIWIAWQRDDEAGEAFFATSDVDISAPCIGDTDESGAVDFDDLLSLLTAWGPCTACAEDLDGDREVGFGDLLLMLANWGDCG